MTRGLLVGERSEVRPQLRQLLLELELVAKVIKLVKILVSKTERLRNAQHLRRQLVHVFEQGKREYHSPVMTVRYLMERTQIGGNSAIFAMESLSLRRPKQKQSNVPLILLEPLVLMQPMLLPGEPRFLDKGLKTYLSYQLSSNVNSQVRNPCQFSVGCEKEDGENILEGQDHILRDQGIFAKKIRKGIVVMN